MGHKKICILGSGAGALTVAGTLTLEGRRVCLWDDGDFAENIHAIIRRNNTITVTGNYLTGEAQIDEVTTDLAQALTGAEMVLLIVPSFAFDVTARKLIPHLRPGMKIYPCCGSTGGALELAKIFHEAGVLNGVKLGEFSTLPLGCKKLDLTTVRVNTRLGYNQFAAFPAKDTPELFPGVKELFPCITPARDVLECSLNNGNIVLHGPVMLLNAAGTEKNPDNHHYRDGITPSVARVMDAVDAERMAVCRALGYEPISTAEASVRKEYCPRLEPTSYETYAASEDFKNSDGPHTLNHRYLTEDIPYSAQVVSVLGRVVNVDTPYTDAMITLCCAMMGQDYWHMGRTTQALGMEGKSLQDLRALLDEGYPDTDK